MKNIISIITTLFLLSQLFGCASPARVEQMAVSPADIANTQTNPNLQNNVSISTVTGGESTNPLWTSEIGNAEFRQALEISLQNANLLGNDTETSKYQLTANMLSVIQPVMGLDLMVTTNVQYMLTEKSSKKTVFDEVITAPHTATVGDAFIAVERLRLANEGAAKENIKILINKLNKLEAKNKKVSIRN